MLLNYLCGGAAGGYLPEGPLRAEAYEVQRDKKLLQEDLQLLSWGLSFKHL